MYRQALEAWKQVLGRQDDDINEDEQQLDSSDYYLPDESLALVHLAILNNYIALEMTLLADASKNNHDQGNHRPNRIGELQTQFCYALAQIRSSSSNRFEYRHFRAVAMAYAGGIQDDAVAAAA